MNIREQLVNRVVAEGGFWSYDKQSVRCGVSDDQLIEAVLEVLDIDEISLLFQLFSLKKIKKIWLRTMVTQGDFYYSLNRFYAWYYFDIRNPDRYLQSMETRYLTKITK